jgi:hypothetical protein
MDLKAGHPVQKSHLTTQADDRFPDRSHHSPQLISANMMLV